MFKCLCPYFRGYFAPNFLHLTSISSGPGDLPVFTSLLTFKTFDSLNLMSNVFLEIKACCVDCRGAWVKLLKIYAFSSSVYVFYPLNFDELGYSPTKDSFFYLLPELFKSSVACCARSFSVPFPAFNAVLKSWLPPLLWKILCGCDLVSFYF